MDNIILFVTFIFILIAACLDYKTYKIPNKLTISMVLIGISIKLYKGTFNYKVFGIVALIYVCTLLVKGIGGGDIKLMLGLTALIDWKCGLFVFLGANVGMGALLLLRYASCHKWLLVNSIKGEVELSYSMGTPFLITYVLFCLMRIGGQI